MKLAIVTDIHGNLPALEAVAVDIRRRGADQVVNLGDSLSGPLLPRETAQFLMAAGWLSLAGNHERQILTHGPERVGASDAYAQSQLTAVELDWLRGLPATARLDGGIFLCHGTPTSDIEYFLESLVPGQGQTRAATRSEIALRLGHEAADLLACGHTHIPRVVRSARGQLLVNPGSVGLGAYDDELPEPHVVETGTPDARYAMVERLPGGWTAALLSVPYPHQAMAQLAQQRGRPDWAQALMTGTMR